MPKDARQNWLPSRVREAERDSTTVRRAAHRADPGTALPAFFGKVRIFSWQSTGRACCDAGRQFDATPIPTGHLRFPLIVRIEATR